MSSRCAAAAAVSGLDMPAAGNRDVAAAVSDQQEHEALGKCKRGPIQQHHSLPGG
jgi:hypothetical protein